MVISCHEQYTSPPYIYAGINVRLSHFNAKHDPDCVVDGTGRDAVPAISSSLGTTDFRRIQHLSLPAVALECNGTESEI